ncbi:hypothetical protein DH2020_043248 [Rehmannia glutinosa]|uniref:B box-type domain-containing protein n=1 Tax=Rehmannia glutinosa TaxID=99300 RepID=A0ABR0UL43_REHGL
MSSSSIDPASRQQDENANQGALGMPLWLEQFMGKTFFEKCLVHPLPGNVLNRYCITCDAPACKHCLSAGHNKEHKVLTIYRHVYQDVVPIDQMKDHIDCEKIQTYKCNKKWVVSLKPLPHTGSGSLIVGDGACEVCRRKLTERDGHLCFCSIACKFEATSRSGIQLLLRAIDTLQTSEENQDQASTSQTLRKRNRWDKHHELGYELFEWWFEYGQEWVIIVKLL